MFLCNYVRLNEIGREGWPKEAQWLGEVIHAQSGDNHTRVKWYDHNRVFVKYEDVMDDILEPIEE